MAASRPFDFAKYKRPHEGPMHKLTRAPAAESDDGEMPAESLSALLGRVSENSTSQIDDLVGNFGRLREKLRIDSQRLQREIEDYAAVCTENSNSDIMVMQSAKDRVGMDTSSSLNWARERRVLI